MSQIDDLLFETERRSILFSRGTSMPDGTQLGYDGDPNSADEGNSDGEFLLHHCPSGTRYIQKGTTPYTLWEKLSDDAGGLWEQAGAGEGGTVDIHLKLLTDQAIGGTRAIASIEGYARYADSNNPDLVAIGLSQGAVSVGEEVTIQQFGKMVMTGAGYTVNKPVYVDSNGTLTQTPAGTEYVQKVGIAHNSETLIVDVSQPIFLGD